MSTNKPGAPRQNQPFSELLAKATPGPWRQHLNWKEQVGTGQRGWFRVVAKCDSQANAELIARCNPATMALVLDALERTKKEAVVGIANDTFWPAINAALEALNSPAP